MYILYIYICTYCIYVCTYILTHIFMIPRQDACAHFAAARPLLQRAVCRDTAWEALKTVQPPKMWNQDDMEPTRCLAFILIPTFIGWTSWISWSADQTAGLEIWWCLEPWNHGGFWLSRNLVGNGMSSQLTKSMIFQRGRYTTNQKYWAYLEYVLNMYRREYWETRIKHVIHHGNTINVGNWGSLLGAKDKRSPSQFWVDGMILGYKVLRSGSQSRNRPLMAEYYHDLAVL